MSKRARDDWILILVGGYALATLYAARNDSIFVGLVYGLNAYLLWLFLTAGKDHRNRSN